MEVEVQCDDCCQVITGKQYYITSKTQYTIICEFCWFCEYDGPLETCAKTEIEMTDVAEALNEVMSS